MYRHLLLNFIQRFSCLQQYLIILSLSFILLLIFHHWWCILLLPLSTILVIFTIKRLSRPDQSPFKTSGYFYNLFIRKRSSTHDDHTDETLPTSHPCETSIQKECDTYIRTIIARYICVWYYPLISTDQEFPEDLMIIFNIILNRLNDRLKSLDFHGIIRLIINLKQQHMEQYLHTLDSFGKQRKQNRISKSVVEEFSQIIGFHQSIVNNDIHAYFKALVELFLTELIPESFHIYSGSHTGREFLSQIIVNCIFLPLFNKFSNPRMIYYLIVLLLETEEQKIAFTTNENSLITQSETIVDQNDREPVTLIENFGDQPNRDDERRASRLERIIYSATIISCDLAYNSMSGAAYTVYIIQCETKSPFTSDAMQRYIIRRRFREFLNLHKRLQQNYITGRHCHDIDEIFQALPIPIDNMNPDIIRRRKYILEQYIQKLISNEVLNCSHDSLEFFAFNSDPNIQFEPLPPSKLPVPRVDKVLLRTLSDVGSKLFTTTKPQLTPLRETFQLNISAVYDNSSSTCDQLKHFIKQSSLRYSSYSLTLNSTDSEFLQSLITRPSIATPSRRKGKLQSDIPLTDAMLNLIQTCLHSRDKIISYESTHQLLRTIFGHFIEEFLKNEIDDLFSWEKLLMYLIDLRTKVLWPDDNNTFIPMRNVKHRAFNACMNRIPNWFQHIVGVENIRRIITNLLQCLSYEEFNQHFICNVFDLLMEQLIPHIATNDFLTKYVRMHAGIRS